MPESDVDALRLFSLLNRKTFETTLYNNPSDCCVACQTPDTFIQKTKQRYNSPRSLSTKINLADMQTEIKLRPPYQLSPDDLQAINGFSLHASSKYKGIGRTRPHAAVPLRLSNSCHLSSLTQLGEVNTGFKLLENIFYQEKMFGWQQAGLQDDEMSNVSLL